MIRRVKHQLTHVTVAILAILLPATASVARDSQNVMGYLTDPEKMMVGFYYLIAGFAMLLLGFILKHKVSKYEFMNRTDGGTVRFKSYGSSVRHNIKYAMARILLVVGMLAVTVGIMAFV